MPLIFYIVLAIFALIVATIITFAGSSIWGAPFSPSDPATVSDMVALADPQPGSEIAELGSGDGRLVAALAAKGATVHGYEINPLLVLISRMRIWFSSRRRHWKGTAYIHRKSFWKASLCQCDTVAVYVYSPTMKQLEHKLKAEMQPGTHIVTNYFGLPRHTPQQVKGKARIYQL